MRYTFSKSSRADGMGYDFWRFDKETGDLKVIRDIQTQFDTDVLCDGEPWLGYINELFDKLGEKAGVEEKTDYQLADALSLAAHDTVNLHRASIMAAAAKRLREHAAREAARAAVHNSEPTDYSGTA